MNHRKEFRSFNRYEYHKGFYNDDDDPTEALSKIKYTDFFDEPEDEDFPFYCAYELLCGSCNHFALSLQKVLNYTPYIIESKKLKGFHAFCQVYKRGRWYYIDARGATTSFNEFMDIAKQFVSDEYVIRPIDDNDIAKWEEDPYYEEEAYKFAEAVIESYKECYEI